MSSALKMEAKRSSETSVYNRPTWRHILEDCIIRSHCSKNRKSYTILWLLVSSTACHAVKPSSAAQDQIFVTVSCKFVAVGPLCYEVMGWSFTSAASPRQQSFSGTSPAGVLTIFYWIWDSPNLEVQFPVFISRRNRVAQLYSRHCSLFLVSYYSQSSSRGIWTCLCEKQHTQAYLVWLCSFCTDCMCTQHLRCSRQWIGTYFTVATFSWCNCTLPHYRRDHTPVNSYLTHFILICLFGWEGISII
jgi:hypothetical protein